MTSRSESAGTLRFNKRRGGVTWVTLYLKGDTPVDIPLRDCPFEDVVYDLVPRPKKEARDEF